MRIPSTQIYIKWRWARFSLLAGLLAFPLAGSAQTGHNLSPPPGPVKPFSSGVAAQGRIVPAGGVVRVAATMGASGQAIVEDLLVKQGDMVEANQLLATLHGRTLAQAQAAAAERDKNAAVAALDQAKAGQTRTLADLRVQVADLTGRAAVADANVRQAVTASNTVLDQAKRDEAAAQTALDYAKKAQLTGQAASAATVATAQTQVDAIPARSHDAEHKIAAAQLEEAKAAKLHADAQLSAQVEQAQAQADLAALHTRQAQADFIVDPAGDDASKWAPVQATAQAAHAAVDSEGKLVETVQAQGVADIAAAQARLDSAEAALLVARAQLALSEVRAPSAGKVLTILARPGEAVGPAGLLQLGDTREMDVDALVYIDDILGVHLGQKTLTTGSALPDEGLSGMVVEISSIVAGNTLPNLDPTVFSDQPVVLVKVKLDAPGPAASVINGQVKVQFAP